MAFEKGTATNYLDLFAKIVTFASANGWTVLEQTGTQVYMKGQGLAGLDEIYVGIRAYEVPASARYNFELYGSWGYVAGRSFNNMPMANGPLSTLYPFVHLWNDALPYWLSVNGRRIICAVKVGTVYQHFYLGFINPPATEAQYPYPLMVAGMSANNTFNYSSGTDVHSYWVNPGGGGVGNLAMPGGGCGRITAISSTDTIPSLKAYSPIHGKRGNIITCPDETYMLFPIYIVSDEFLEVYGQIDGIFQISGYNNASENTLTIGGVEYTVLQDLSRTGYTSFCAMRNN